MSDPSTQWYYAAGSEQRGPLAADQMRAMIAAGTLTRETLVWSPAMSGWQPLGQTELAGPPPAARPGPAFTSAAPSYGTAPAYGAAPGYAGGMMSGGAAPPVGFMDSIKICFGKYARWRGRASRSEFWYFYLFYMLVLVVFGAFDGYMVANNTVSFLSTIAVLVLLLPQLAVTVRRLHDTDRTGWWYWIIMIPVVGAILFIVWLCERGTPGPNRYG